MFRADQVNSGRVDKALHLDRQRLDLLFPESASQTCRIPPTQPAEQGIGTVQVAPILGNDNIFVGSSDGNVYKLTYDGALVILDFPILLPGPVISTPLLGGEDEFLFVPSTGSVSKFEVDRGVETGTVLVLGAAAGSLNIWDGDGTLFQATDGGVYIGICPNSVLRYQVTFPPTQSTVAIAQDPTKPDEETPIIVAAGLNGQVRAYNIRSRQFWSFFASADINAAVLIDKTSGQFGQFYVADAAGNVFAGNLVTGARNPAFTFPTAEAGIFASMALGRDNAASPRLYVADLGGTVYAVDRATGGRRLDLPRRGPDPGIAGSRHRRRGGRDHRRCRRHRRPERRGNRRSSLCDFRSGMFRRRLQASRVGDRRRLLARHRCPVDRCGWDRVFRARGQLHPRGPDGGGQQWRGALRHRPAVGEPA